MNKKLLIILSVIIILILTTSYFLFRNFQENIESQLTAEEMADKINVALRDGDYNYLWNHLHPDDQSYWGDEKCFKEIIGDYTELGFDFWEMNRFFLEDAKKKEVEILKSWEHPVTNKKYYQVTEVPVILPFDENMDKATITLIHLQRVKGNWKYFTATNKEEVTKTLVSLLPLQWKGSFQSMLDEGARLLKLSGETDEYIDKYINDMKKNRRLALNSQIMAGIEYLMRSTSMYDIYESKGNYDYLNLNNKEVKKVANKISEKASRLIINHDTSVNSQTVCMYAKLLKETDTWYCADNNKGGETNINPNITCNNVSTVCPSLIIEQ